MNTLSTYSKRFDKEMKEINFSFVFQGNKMNRMNILNRLKKLNRVNRPQKKMRNTKKKQ
jgi:hypothetical protein